MHRPLAIALLLLSLGTSWGCAHQDFKQIPYSSIPSVWMPYSGANFEVDLFSLNVAQARETTWGFNAAQFNFFYKLALGPYIAAGVPAVSGEDSDGDQFSWVVSGGLIVEPVITRHLKLAGQFGFAGFVYSGNAATGSSGGMTPGIEGALGLFTAFHYRAGIDFYFAKSMDSQAEVDPMVFGVRLHLVGFSWWAFNDKKTGLVDHDNRISPSEFLENQHR